MTGFNKIRMAVSHGPDLHFDGKVVGEYSTQRKDGGKSRWTELRLWETPAGNYIAEMVGCSTVGNEGEIRAARVLGHQELEGIVAIKQMDLSRPETWESDGADEPRPSLAQRRDAMDLWQWTTAAKAFARDLGWDVIRRVE